MNRRKSLKQQLLISSSILGLVLGTVSLPGCGDSSSVVVEDKTNKGSINNRIDKVKNAKKGAAQ